MSNITVLIKDFFFFSRRAYFELTNVDRKVGGTFTQLIWLWGDHS